MNRAITVSHEYGNGEREIGKKLAQRLNIPPYDEELVVMIIEEGNIETSVLEVDDEVNPDLDDYSLRQTPSNYQIAMIQQIYTARATVIHNLNDKGPCVIIGRYVDTTLLGVINILIFANMESCINRIISLNPGLTKEEVKASILAVDKRRKAYDEYYSTAQWGDMNVYDIYLNNGLAGVEGCPEAALAYIEYIE